MYKNQITMSVEPDPIDGKSAVEIDNVPSKANYTVPNASCAASASTKVKVGGVVFALILTAAGITGGVVSTGGGGVTNTTTTQAVVSSTAEPGTNAATTIR